MLNTSPKTLMEYGHDFTNNITPLLGINEFENPFETVKKFKLCGASLEDYFENGNGVKIYPIHMAIHTHQPLDVIKELWIPLPKEEYLKHCNAAKSNKDIVSYLTSKKYTPKNLPVAKKAYSTNVTYKFDKIDDMQLKEFFVAFNTEDDSFVNYLYINGSRENLVNLFIKMEQYFDMPCAPMYVFTKFFKNKCWEIPTKELCNGIVNLLRYLNIDTIHEIGSGNGLLAACIAKHDEKLTINCHEPMYTEDNLDVIFNPEIPHNYMPAFSTKWGNFEGNYPILSSWIHPSLLKECISCIKKNKNEYIIFIGVGISENSPNLSPQFDKTMINELGYYKYIIPFKQICQSEYFLNDTLNTEHKHKSCTIIYSKRKICFDKFLHDNVEYIGECIDSDMIDKYIILDRDNLIATELKIKKILNSNDDTFIKNCCEYYLSTMALTYDRGQRQKYNIKQ